MKMRMVRSLSSPIPPRPPLMIEDDDLDLEANQQISDGHDAFNREAVQVRDFSNRASWRLTFVLALNEGLLSTAGLFIGYLQFIDKPSSLVIIWIAQLASSVYTEVQMNLVKFYTEYNSKLAQIRREAGAGSITGHQVNELKTRFPGPWLYIGASVTGTVLGSLVPLLATLLFVNNYTLQLAILVPVVCVAVTGLGGWVAVLRKVPVVNSAARFLIGAVVVMVVAYATNLVY